MPNRIIRDAILTSQAVTSLDWPEEVFYRRLMSVVDDYGRCESFPQLLRSRCYPLQTDKVRVADISRWMAACQTAGLIAVYVVSGKEYLQLEKFGQQQRSPSKCPDPPAVAITCPQVLADDPLVVSVVVDVEEKSSPSAPEARFEKFWEAYPRKVGKDAARKAFDKRKPDDLLLTSMLRSIEIQARSEGWRKDGGQFIPHPSTWLNEGRWQDEAVSLVVVGSAAVEETMKRMDADRMTPEQRVSADKARVLAMSSLKNITRQTA